MKQKLSVVKQNVGVDVSKDTFSVALMIKFTSGGIRLIATKEFANTLKGFIEFNKWIKSHSVKDCGVEITMEATGVYYENLAFYLYEKGYIIHILLPQVAKRYMQSYNIKAKTDKVDARLLAQMGVERQLEVWRISSLVYRKLRALNRERMQLIKIRTKLKNQLHSKEASATKMPEAIARKKALIRFINKQIKDIVKQMQELVSQDIELKERLEKVMTIPGVNFITAIAIISETLGFTNFKSIKQLTSYAGYDVSIRQSGKWKGKSRISKKGNSYIRYAMYMPSMALVRLSPHYKEVYQQINQRKQTHLIALVAIQRKLLGLIFTLWRKNQEYIEGYHKLQKTKVARAL